MDKNIGPFTRRARYFRRGGDSITKYFVAQKQSKGDTFRPDYRITQ